VYKRQVLGCPSLTTQLIVGPAATPVNELKVDVELLNVLACGVEEAVVPNKREPLLR
jgi:hypothetical protein